MRLRSSGGRAGMSTIMRRMVVATSSTRFITRIASPERGIDLTLTSAFILGYREVPVKAGGAQVRNEGRE